ncbi:hypothetical protein D3C80_2052740 [compost metagenome]
MQDPAVAVTAFASQVIALFGAGVGFGIKQHALVDQPLDAMTRITGDKFHRFFIA